MKLKLTTLYEDGSLWVINKPAGITVNRATTTSGETVADLAFEHLGLRPSFKVDDELSARSGLAHRLDKETSGCLVLAKSTGVLMELMRQFKEREVKKQYLALVHGKLEPKRGTIKLPLTRDRVDRRRWAVGYEGKMAETAWEVVGYYLSPARSLGGEVWSLVRLFPVTGRTHQIRVHMAHLGHPLVSDSKYLIKRKLAEDKRVLGRHALHAEMLELTHPVTGERVKFKAPLAEDLERLVRKLLPIDVEV